MTTAMPELSRGEIIDLISAQSKNSADHDIEFANRVIDALAALQAQQSTQGDAQAFVTPAEVSDAELRKTIDALRDPGTVSAFYNGYYTLTPDELRRAILALHPQAVPMTDEPQSAPKLIGWRTENFLWETDDVDKARNWEPNIGVLPIFEGDPNTKLGSRGITAQGAQGEQG